MALILLKSEIKVPLCPYCYRYKITLFPRICLILKWKSRVVAYEQFSFLLWVSENLRNFALQVALKPRSRGWGRGCDIMKSVYPRWFLTLWNSRKIQSIVKDWATVNARGYVIILQPARCSARNMAGCTNCIYKRRASSLPSNYWWAMREASESRTVTDTDSYAFSV